MKKLKIMCVFGTRPEANKMIPLILSLQNCPLIEAEVCVTAQHREILDQMLTPFHIQPDYDLNIMTPGQSLADIFCRALKGLEGVFEEAAPDVVLAHGDTLTTFAASLASFYATNGNANSRPKLGHVEAGLRSYNKFQPYPEEVNRKLTAALADFHFAPTTHARDNLLKENISEDAIFVTGNTAIDLLCHTIKEDYIFNNDDLNRLDFNRRIITMTAHRRENWGQPLENICRAVKRLTHDFDDITVVWPIHPNPRLYDIANSFLADNPRVLLTVPTDVFDMHNLMKRSYCVLTDSGGIQEEALGIKKPTVVLREVTERPEGVEAGALVLAGVEEEKIYTTAASILTDNNVYQRMTAARNPFGDGKASERIVQALLYSFGLAAERPLPL